MKCRSAVHPEWAKACINKSICVIMKGQGYVHLYLLQRVDFFFSQVSQQVHKLHAFLCLSAWIVCYMPKYKKPKLSLFQ